MLWYLSHVNKAKKCSRAFTKPIILGHDIRWVQATQNHRGRTWPDLALVPAVRSQKGPRGLQPLHRLSRAEQQSPSLPQALAEARLDTWAAINLPAIEDILPNRATADSLAASSIKAHIKSQESTGQCCWYSPTAQDLCLQGNLHLLQTCTARLIFGPLDENPEAQWAVCCWWMLLMEQLFNGKAVLAWPVALPELWVTPQAEPPRWRGQGRCPAYSTWWLGHGTWEAGQDCGDAQRYL